MREHMHHASARRDEGLARIRKISLWITGGAAFASLGLGTAFAHALPGHASAVPSSATRGGAPAGGSLRTGGGPTQPGAVSSGDRNSGRVGGRHALAKPAQAPQSVSNPAAPLVSSGGS
jgi:hypothetical protein